MARPIKLLSFIVVAFVAVGLLLSPRIGVARPIPVNKAFVIRDGEQHGCRAEDLNAAPFAAPSKAHRWGTVVVGCYTDKFVAQLEEWDLYAGRVLRTVKLPTPPDDNQIRVAHGAGHVAVVLADALQGGGKARLLLLDDAFKLKKSWDLKGSVDYTDISADGALAALAGRGQTGMRVVGLDLAHERIIARRVISYGRQAILPAYDCPEQIVRVHKKDIFVAMHVPSRLRVLRLDKKLRVRAAYVRHRKDVDYGAGEYWLALDRGAPVLQVRGRIYTLHRYLGSATPLRSAMQDHPSWAFSKKGQVATEDGRIAASKSAPFVRALRYSNEVVVRGLKREIRANATRYVFWAFGRAVIVRSAWNVGITAIQPR